MLKKSFWILIILLTTLCAYLAADLISVYLKKQWDVPPKISLLSPSKEQGPEQNRNMRGYYKIITQRDLFRIHSGKEIDSAPGDEEIEEVAPITDLKLKLLGTIIGRGIAPYAIIKDLKTNKQDMYMVGDRIGPAELIKIYRHKVILRREGAEEMLVAFEDLEPAEVVSEASLDSPEEPFKRLPTQLGQKIGPNHWVLQREEVQDALSNASQLLTQVRIIPHFNGGNINQPDGFQVANIRTRSFFDRMGLKSGDIIKSVNGQPVNNPDKAFEAYQRLKNEPRIQVNVLRNNKEVSLKYDIND